MRVDITNKKLEFACAVCLAKKKQENPNMIDCAFRNLDGEYCNDLIKQYEIEKKHEAALNEKRYCLKLYRVTIIKGIKKKIEQAIDEMSDPILREIMFRNVVRRQTLEQIAVEMNYSKRHIERKKLRALEAIKISEEMFNGITKQDN